MANEFVARNGVLAQNNSQVTGSLSVSNGITGNLTGTASFATSASNALTASYLAGGVPSGFPYTGSAIISGSLQVTGSLYVSNGITGDLTGTASFATSASRATSTLNADTASYVLNAVSASRATSALNATTASLAQAVAGGFSKSFAIVNTTNILTTDIGTFNAWRANTPCTASMILGYRDTGTTAAVSASRNGLPLISTPLTLSTTNGWVSSSVLQNQNFNTGDILTFSLLSFTGGINDITIQVSFTY